MNSQREFGKREEFSVSVSLDRDYGGVWMFGKICYWIAGHQIGDFELGTSLRDVLLQMWRIVTDCGQRQASPSLAALTADDLFSRIRKTLWGGEDTGYEDIALSETWARFDITIPVDVFDGWKVFQLDYGSKSRLIWNRMDSSQNTQEVSIPLGKSDQAICELYTYLDEIHERERLQT